jgi:hypothetical protein
MKKAFAALLRLYPRRYRRQFGAERAAVFEQALDAERERPLGSFVRFLGAELLGLVVGAGTEWIARFSSPNYGRSDCNMMKETVSEQGTSLPVEITQSQERIRELVGNMVKAIATHSFEKARFYSNEERKEKENLRLLMEKHGLREMTA